METSRFKLFFTGLVLFTLALFALGVFKAPMHALGNAQSAEQGYLFDQGSVVFSKNPDVQAISLVNDDTGSWVTLPDSWDTSRPFFDGQAWYQFDIELDPKKPLPNAVFFPRAIMNAQAYINGQKIGGTGSMTGELARRWNFPYFFQFPETLLKPTGNVLQIQVAGYSNYRSGLGRVWLGTSSSLEPIYRAAYRWQVTASMIAMLVAFASGVLMILFSRFTAPENGLMFLGIAVLVFALRNIGYFVDWTPLPHLVWSQVVHSLHAWFASLYGHFLIRYMGLKLKPLRMALWLYAIAVTLLTFGYSSQAILQFTALFLLPILPFFFGINIALLVFAWRKKDSEATILGCSSLLFVLLSTRDLSIMVNALPNESVFLSQLTGVALFVSGVWILLQRFRFMFKQLQDANQSLNSELALREKQLMRQFNAIRQIEERRTKDDERRRIMQDIHDGVGSSLVSALNQSELRPLQQEEMREVLQECLDDLRMAIDSLDPLSDDLLALLGNLRWRYERRLKAANIDMVWQVDDIPKLEGYSSRDLFDLLRIVQETFNNTLKHSQATQMNFEVRWQAEHERAILNIHDNGVGHTPGQAKQGRGLEHIRTRAKGLGLDLELGPGQQSQGFGITLHIPRRRHRL